MESVGSILKRIIEPGGLCDKCAEPCNRESIEWRAAMSNDFETGIIDLEDLLSRPFDPEEGARPRPDVQFDRKNLTLKVHHQGKSYEVDLCRCNDPGQILDWIFQLNGKSWMSNELMGQFIEAFEVACWQVFGNSPQGVFCPGGDSVAANWRESTNSNETRIGE